MKRKSLTLTVVAIAYLVFNLLCIHAADPTPVTVAAEKQPKTVERPTTSDITPTDPNYFIPNRFKGKTILITGAARGMGRAAAIRAAREGANVVVMDWLPKEGAETTETIVKAGGKAILVLGDVRKTPDCDRMVAEAVKAFGRLDYAINNAGVMDGLYSGDPFDYEKQKALLPNPIHEASDEYFDNVLAVNTLGMFKSLRAELRQMVAQGKGGAIVNVGSIAALTGLAGNPAYVASKHAVTGLTRNAAIDYAPHGIRVNSVNMAATDTPMVDKAILFVQAKKKEGDGGNMGGLKTQSILMAADSKRRPATVWEQVSVMLFLLSDDASALTGGCYATDGGWTAY
jgi:NAD(P)-dependent dehydrogenase (short-subunit alcohol dehydrogenase family)